MNLLPNLKELRALMLFVSKDETRPYLAHLWRYESDGGETFMATDGHTLALRRSGTHREMTLGAVCDLPASAVVEDGKAQPHARPPRWSALVVAPAGGELAERYSISSVYFGRIGDVEAAAGARAADDYVPRVGESKKARRSQLRAIGALAQWRIPSDALGPWYWSIEAVAARWEGIIMPRRT